MSKENNFLDLYKECSNSLRHYSEIIRNGRTLTVVQGIVILSAIVYTIKNNYIEVGLILSIFGLCFTGVFWRQLNNHSLIFDEILTLAVKYEKMIFSESKITDTPWSKYNAVRTENFEKFLYRTTVINGPSIIISLVFIVLFFYCLSHIKG